MRIHRIYGAVLRYVYSFTRSYDRIGDAFYWPTIDLILWGLTSMYIVKQASNNPTILPAVLSGLLLWMIIWQGQYEISVNLLQELWDKNLVNIFVAPLKFSEWVVALLTISIVKALASFIFASILAFVFYKMNILILGFKLVPFIILLFMTSWTIGFTVAGLLLRYGTKIQTFAWTTAYIVAPFSAVYYPVSILPKWAQVVSYTLPSSYVFEGAREVIQTGNLDSKKILISLLLNIFYLTLSFIFLRKSFNSILRKGLVKVY